MSARVPEALRRFIWDIQSMVELADSPREILFIGRDLMARLVAEDGWLPAAYGPQAEVPALYELYRDEMERFSVTATVFAPGQSWPLVRSGVWEMTGVLRGPLVVETEVAQAGKPLATGQVESHGGQQAIALSHGGGEGTAVAIQVHGGDIGRLPRTVIGRDGATAAWTSGYANPPDLPAYDILTIQAEIVY